MQVEFNRLVPLGREISHINEVIASAHPGAGGAFGRRCEQILSAHFSGSEVLLTASATASLEIAAMLLDLKDGDEVIMPSFTFVSTANAFCLHGARVRFVDIRPDTLNIDPKAVEAAITERTRAIVPVHYAGVAADPDKISAIAAAQGLTVIEDAAQALGAGFGGKPLGSFGSCAAISFHETKNIGCGEGGALVVNDPMMRARAHVLRDVGTNRAAFRNGLVDKYTWVDVGSSYGLSELSAAFLFGQLEMLDALTTMRQNIWNIYYQGLQGLAASGHFVLPTIPSDCQANAHIFQILLPDRNARDAMIRNLRQRGVEAVFHYVPLHSSPMGLAMGYQPGDLPVTEDIAGRLLRLPVYASLSEQAAHYVIDAVHASLLAVGAA